METLESDEGVEVLGNPKFNDGFQTCLTELVRNRYLNYLKKQLQENIITWIKTKENDKNEDEEHLQLQKQLANFLYSKVEKCAEMMEEKALKKCMIAQLYQRAMIKTISVVRRSTQECYLEDQLQTFVNTNKTLNDNVKVKYVNKSTQTMDDNLNSQNLKCKCVSGLIWREQLNIIECQNETIAASSELGQKPKISPGFYNDCYNGNNSNENFTETYQQTMNKPSSLSNNIVNCSSSILSKTETEYGDFECDEIDKELARLFTEGDEIDEMFGINSSAACDDLQTKSILQEIYTSKLSYEVKESSGPVAEHPEKVNDNSTITTSKIETELINQKDSYQKHFQKQHKEQYNQQIPLDLRYSPWPCELFFRRRILNKLLMELVEKDLRWHDIIKRKFHYLFGEDSDDEFAVLSPSIELDEILMNSCIRRISPWLVKHLMKPLCDGLIGNRFLFKRLAKKMAHCIILRNQYPNEHFIKQAVENFFCVRRSVLSEADLNYVESCV